MPKTIELLIFGKKNLKNLNYKREPNNTMKRS